jgi:hypothetical protein
VKLPTPPIQTVLVTAVGAAGIGYTVMVVVKGVKVPQQLEIKVNVTVYVIGVVPPLVKVIEVVAVFAELIDAAGETDHE